MIIKVPFVLVFSEITIPKLNQNIYVWSGHSEVKRRSLWGHNEVEWRHSTVETADDSRVNSRMKVIISNRVVVTITCTVRVCIVKSKILNLHDLVMNSQILIFLQICFHHLKQFLNFKTKTNFLSAKIQITKSWLWARNGFLVRCGSVRVEVARTGPPSQNWDRPGSVGVFYQTFLCWENYYADVSFLLWKKWKLFFLVKYRHRVRHFPGNRNWHNSHGINAISWGKL